MNVRGVWQDGMSFTIMPDSGHEIVVDAGEDHGGNNQGPRPMELLLAGTIGCTGMDVISVLEKMRQDVQGLEINLKAERRDEDPKTFKYVEIEYVVHGNVEEGRLQRAVELSETKYCSAIATLRELAEIVTSWRVVPPGNE